MKKEPKPFSQIKTIKAQKRRIVKDAIFQIEAGTIIANQGDYLRFSDQTFTMKPNQSLQTVLKSGKYCECCAKGALFAACVIETNDVKGKDDFKSELFQTDKLSTWFKKSELDTIEAAFEGHICKDTENVLQKKDDTYTKKGKMAFSFYYKYTTEEERLLAILNNILKNGEFTP